MRISRRVIAIKPSVSHPARSLCRLDWSRSPTEEAIGLPFLCGS
jgi:hypothetical protein